jgi:hypothetical protein
MLAQLLPSAKLVLEGTLTPPTAATDLRLIEAVGRAGARAYLHSPTMMALYLPSSPPQAILSMPHVHIHQLGDKECTLLVPVASARAPLKSIGVMVNGYDPDLR